jgi:hypothetical protein
MPPRPRKQLLFAQLRPGDHLSTIATAPAADRSKTAPRAIMRLLQPACLATCLLLALLMLARCLVVNIHSRIIHDVPAMMYVAMVVDRFHEVPYRQVIDLNPPGYYLIYAIVGRLSGYRDYGVRVVETVLLGILMVSTGLMLRGFGRGPALVAPIVFGICYLICNWTVSMQREYFIIVFLSLALALTLNQSRTPVLSVAANALIGLCVTLKPQCAAVWFLFLAYNLSVTPANLKDRLNVAGAFVAGAAIPLLAMVAYLVQERALGTFLTTIIHYWPIYGTLNTNLVVMTGAQHWQFIAKSLFDACGFSQWIFPAVIGVAIALTRSQIGLVQRKQVLLLLSLTLFFFAYPAISGQFWAYHGLPFLYFAVVLSSVCFTQLAPGTINDLLSFAAIGALYYVLWTMAPTVQGMQPVTTPTGGRPDEIASFLRGHLREGDTVQPMDWIDGGVLQAMMYADAKPATSCIGDAGFYFAVSNPFVIHLCADFMRQLTLAKPRFIIVVDPDVQHLPHGPDTRRTFPEFDSYLGSHYHVAQADNGYAIWERGA